MIIKPIVESVRDEINKFITDQWFSNEMIIRGEIVDLKKVNGFYIKSNNKIIGLITHRIINSECEVLSLDSLRENTGIGTALLNNAKYLARKSNCSCMKLITTNDNLNALRFYQKRGFVISNIYLNSIEKARRLKPEIPLVGNYGIPIRDEIELKLFLN